MNVLFWMSTSFQTTSRHLLISVLEELSSSGHQVTVLKKCFDGEKEDLPEELNGRNIVCISIPVKASGKGNLFLRYVKDIAYVLKCKKTLRIKYDAVFVQSSNVAGILFRVLQKTQPKAAKTFNVQDIFPENAAYSGKLREGGFVYSLIKRSQAFAYRYSDHIITISEDMKNTLVSDGASADKIDVIYNWSYQDEPYEGLDLTPVSQIFSKDYFNVVYAGNIGVMQNVDLLIDVAKLMKNDESVWFHIIGNGILKSKLEARVKESGIKNISFWPMLPAEFAPLIYSAADINVIPLVKGIFRTALPSKTATCLACQKPVIFAIGKESLFGQWISKLTGCPIVDSNDPEELSRAILSIKDARVVCQTKSTFKLFFSKTHNSHRYAEIITGGS